MISNLKRKKGLISIIAILLFLVISFLTTVFVYNGIFSRYDCPVSHHTDSHEKIITERKTYNYKCGKNTLTGFLYTNDTSQKEDTLIVLAPGFNACSDNYLWQIKELLDYGWSVFSFDTTGCCHSEGNSAIGFSQEFIDLKATLDFIESQNRFDFNNIVLLGHSRGGYAVCCALETDYNLSAVISVSGINSAMEGIISASSQYLGNLAYTNYGFLWLYQTMLFGSNVVNLRADEILSSTDTPALIIHGSEDTQVPINKFSIISHKEDIQNNNVEYYVCTLPENSGHTDLLFDKDNTADDKVIKKINDFLIEKLK